MSDDSTSDNSTSDDSTSDDSTSNNSNSDNDSNSRTTTVAIRSRTAAISSKNAAIRYRAAAIRSRTAASVSRNDASFSWGATSLSWRDASLFRTEASLSWDDVIRSGTTVISSRTAAIRSETAVIRSETDAIRSEAHAIWSEAMRDTPSTSSDSEEEHSDTCNSDDMNEDTREYYEELALNPRRPRSFDRFLDLPKELRLMIYEYAADCQRRFRFVNRYVAITNYESITPIHLTCRAICAEAAHLMKSIVEAQRVPQAMRVPRIIVNERSWDKMDGNSEVISKICRVCEEARSKKVSVKKVDKIMRKSDADQYGKTGWPYHQYSERACEVIANFANSAAMYFARHDPEKAPSLSFPPLSNDAIVVYVALVDAPIEETPFFRSFFKDVGVEMQQHVGPCMDSTEDIHEEYSVIGEENDYDGKHSVVLYDVRREPREWEEGEPPVEVYYEGVIDEEAWERDWT